MATRETTTLRRAGPTRHAAEPITTEAATPMAETQIHTDPDRGSGTLLDAKGASLLLNVPASWVAAQARAGRIPHVRLGRYVRFEPDALRDWWRERRRGPWRDERPRA
jgi:excisionase family DNA binding protein